MDFYDFISSLKYSAASILFIEIPLEFPSNGLSKKRKFLVLADDKEPPLYFLINSASRRFGEAHQLKLYGKDYDFLTNEISYLDYEQEYQSYGIDLDQFHNFLLFLFLFECQSK